MKIEHRLVDKERGIVQITTPDERFYALPKENGTYEYVPSVSWICSFYPKGIGYMRWLADHGWDEAEALKVAAGDKGSRVHKAITDILLGKTVKIDDKYSANGEEPLELAAVEYEAIMSFVNWITELSKTSMVEVMATDYTLVNPVDNYAGTIDIKMRINGEVWIIDIKTSKDIYPSHELQVSAYKAADAECQKIAILQVGYTRNKAKYKFTEIEDQYPLFKAAQQIWAKETAGQQPSQKDFPLELAWNKPKPMGQVDGLVATLEKLDVVVKKKRVVKRKSSKTD